MQNHARARGGFFCNLCQPFWNCKQKITHSALPSSLVMRHGAYSKTHKQKHKVQSGEA
jgi:hypothetical protein